MSYTKVLRSRHARKTKRLAKKIPTPPKGAIAAVSTDGGNTWRFWPVKDAAK